MPISEAVRRHWPEYLIEAAGLACFMLSACFFTALMEHPASPVRQAIPIAFWRRLPIGLAMGSTAVAIIYSPWGQRSGAHLNPSVTLTFLTLGKIHGGDAFFYVGAQFAAGVAGVTAASWLMGGVLRFTAPVLGMLLAGRCYRLGGGIRGAHCAKLDHALGKPCIFRCNYGEL